MVAAWEELEHGMERLAARTIGAWVTEANAARQHQIWRPPAAPGHWRLGGQHQLLVLLPVCRPRMPLAESQRLPVMQHIDIWKAVQWVRTVQLPNTPPPWRRCVRRRGSDREEALSHPTRRPQGRCDVLLDLRRAVGRRAEAAVRLKPREIASAGAGL